MEFNAVDSRKAASFKIFAVAFAVYPHLAQDHQITQFADCSSQTFW